MKYGLQIKMISQSGRRDELIAVLQEAATLLNQVDGCLQYLVSTSKDPRSVWITEVWTSKQAHDETLSQPAVRSLVQKGALLLAAVPQQLELQVRLAKNIDLS